MTGSKGHSFRIVRTIVLAALVAAPGASVGAAPPSAENPAALIYAGWFGNTIPTPSFVAANFNFLETRPFDGLVMYLRKPDLSSNLTVNVMKNTAISYQAMMEVLSPVANLEFSQLQHNLGLVQGSTPPDFFDDWSTVVQNWANLAKASKDSGLKGICFDNEQYHAPWGNYGSHLKYYSTKSFSEYQAQARLRGKQLMEAMVAEYPDVVLLTLHGPYISEPDAPSGLQFPQWQSGNELMGPFFAGHAEGAGSTGCNIDGGELYTLRSADHFQASYYWRRHELPSDEIDCSFIPSALRQDWAARSCLSFGVYDCAFGGASMSASILRSTLANAMKQADKYVWFYAEAATYLLPPGSGGASQTWVDAIAGAQADVVPAPSPSPAPAVPAAPTGLAASAVSPFDIDLSWTDNSANETGFQIERKTVINGSWSLVTTTAADVTYLRNGSLWSGTGYVYRIRAANASGASSYTSEVTVTTPLVQSLAPAAPSGLSGSAPSPFDIDLAWSDNSSSETGFQIERKLAINGMWAHVATREAGSTTYRDSSLWSGTGYIYRVRAVNGYGNSAYTSEVTVTTQLVSGKPAAPSNLNATLASNTSVNLSWTDNSFNENGFAIERRRSGGSWAQVGWVAHNVTTYQDTGRSSGVTYVYRVKAFNAKGNSPNSADARITMP
jgi:hypothetical protein